VRLLSLTGLIAIMTAAALAAGLSSATVAAPSSQLAVGDQLAYAVTVELQQHHVRGKGKGSDTLTESSAQGTATFTVYAINADGTALANVALDLTGSNAGQPVALQTATPGKILANGELRTKAQVGLGVSDAISAADTAIDDIGAHEPLAVGKSWSHSAKTAFVAMTVTRTVSGVSNYRGLSAVALQSAGKGSLHETADGKPAAGDITVGGTTYYDSHNHLLVGEALRTLTVVAPPGQNLIHDDYSAEFNVVLNSWTHTSPPAASSEAPAAVESSPEAEQTTPPPTPMPFIYSTPVATVTPELSP
jgi:hypothetical protein